MKKYIDAMHHGYGTWFWANESVVKAAKEVGWESLDFSLHESDKIAQFDEKQLQIYVDNLLAPVQPGDLVVHQFPFPPAMGASIEIALINGIRQRSAFSGLFIHDITSWMREDQDFERDQETYIKAFDFVVVATKPAERRLREAGITSPIFTYSLFDYPIETPKELPSFAEEVFFAGGLSRAKGLLDWPNQSKLIVFDTAIAHGDALDAEEWVNEVNQRVAGKNVEFRNYLLQSELSNAFPSGFGLVYYENDGAEKSGDYARYNAPNKLSLYLAANLPVIVEKQMAAAQFIESNGLGFAIENLAEIDEKIKAISEEDYQAMVDKTVKIGKLLRSGFFAKRVFSEIDAFGFTKGGQK